MPAPYASQTSHESQVLDIYHLYQINLGVWRSVHIMKHRHTQDSTIQISGRDISIQPRYYLLLPPRFLSFFSKVSLQVCGELENSHLESELPVEFGPNPKYKTGPPPSPRHSSTLVICLVSFICFPVAGVSLTQLGCPAVVAS